MAQWWVPLGATVWKKNTLRATQVGQDGVPHEVESRQEGVAAGEGENPVRQAEIGVVGVVV